jgi:predicted ATP-grasp superfamily ATP-dependent carboligase
MQLQDNSTPVVILRSIAYCGLGVARTLGRLSVPVYTVEGVESSPVFHSRYNRGRFVWSIDERPEAESLQYLREVSTQIGGRPLLIPTTDYAALFVARNSKQLGHSFQFPQQPEGLVAALSSKKEMYLLAKGLGIPTPETSFPQKREDVEEFLASARLPVMLKAIDGTRLCSRTGKKMFVVRSADELLSLYDKVEEPGAPNLMLQEYIPGGEDSVWMFNGYFNDDSECLLGFTGQKIRQCPAYTGYTSLGICRRNETVDSLTRTFMKSIGYRGILDVGYRYDARDGKYKVLDVNPRIGATFRLFVGDNGMDVARAFYLDMTARPVPQSHVCEGRKWMVEDRDLMSSIRYWRDGYLGATTWLRSLTGIRETAYLASDDMGPVFARFRSVMRTAFQRGVSVLKQATSRPSQVDTHKPAPQAKLRAA